MITFSCSEVKQIQTGLRLAKRKSWWSLPLPCEWAHQRKMCWLPHEGVVNVSSLKGSNLCSLQYCQFQSPTQTPFLSQAWFGGNWPYHILKETLVLIWHPLDFRVFQGINRWISLSLCLSLSLSLALQISIYIHLYIHRYLHIRTYMHTYIHTYLPTYLRTYVRTYLHTYIHSFHSIPFHSIPFHYIPFHSIPFHYITFHSIPFHCIALHYITLHYITLHYITLHYITLHYITLHYITLHTYIEDFHSLLPDSGWKLVASESFTLNLGSKLPNLSLADKKPCRHLGWCQGAESLFSLVFGA